MATFPSNVNTGLIEGSFASVEVTAAGLVTNALTGSVSFQAAPKYFVYQAAKQILLPTSFTVNLVDGAFSVPVLATDEEQFMPIEWTWKVSFNINGLALDAINISVPTDSVRNLTAVMPPAGSPSTGVVVTQGTPGKSAYEVALDNGFVGTQAQWLASLVGAGGGAVSSINTKTGAVVLSASDVGAATAAQGAKADSAVQPSAITSFVTTSDARLSDARTPVMHTTALISNFTTAVDARVQNIVGAAPAALDTLVEISAALGNDANYAATMTTALAGKVANTRQITAGTGLTGGGDLTANRTLAVTYGTTAGTSAQGNDTRLTDARAPLAHKATHASGGSDPITPADIGAAPVSGQFPVNTVAASGAALTIPATYPAHNVTLSANCTLTFAAPTAGHAFVMRLNGAFAPTFPASVKWPGGTAPTYAAAGTLYQFVTLDAGTTWLGTGQAHS